MDEIWILQVIAKVIERMNLGCPHCIDGFCDEVNQAFKHNDIPFTLEQRSHHVFILDEDGDLIPTLKPYRRE